MKNKDDVEKKIRELLRRTGLLVAWEDVKDDLIKRREIEHLAFEKEKHDNEIYNILLNQDGCLWCKKRLIKSKEAYFVNEDDESGGIICRRCWNHKREIEKAHPDFKCKCGAYLSLPENINIWTKEDGIWVCISCSHRKKTARIKDIDMEGKIFVPVIRYKLNGHLLFVVRERAGLSVKQIAAYCKWSLNYQYKLEKANQGFEQEVYTIAMETKNKIENAFIHFTGKSPEEWLKA